MKILLCILSVAFGGLSMFASISQIKTERKLIPGMIMTIGSAVLIAAVICSIIDLQIDYVVALFGCAAICASAIWNGKKNGNFHIQHHIIRILLSIILIVGLAFL